MHLGSLSMGAAGLLMVEMTNVTMDGRISTRCATLCTDENEASLKRVVDFCKTYGVAKLGIQLGHAGRQGSQHPPALGGKAMTADEHSEARRGRNECVNQGSTRGSAEH